MRGLTAVCVVGLVVACGGKSSHDVLDPAPFEADGPDVVDAGGPDVVDAADDGSVEPVSLDAGTCMSSTSSGVLSGNIAGVPTTVDTSRGGASIGFPVVQASWGDLRASSSDEALMAWGTGGPDGGAQESAGALIVVPKPGTGSTFYCAAGVAASASPTDTGHAISIALTDLSVLGECPGTRVSGKIEVCLDGTDSGTGCTERFGVSGTVDGSDVELRNVGGTVAIYNTADFRLSVVGDGNDRGVIVFGNPHGGDVKGWLRVPEDASANAGSVFCLSDALVVEQDDGGHAITFRSVGRLGSCPGTPVAGELGYCSRYR